MRLILRFLREHALRYWPYYMLGLFAVYATNKLTVMVPNLVKEALDALDQGDAATSLNRAGWIAAAAIAIVIVRTISRVSIFNPGRAAEFNFKNRLVRHLLSLPQSFHDKNRVGDLMSRATNDLRNVRALVGFAGLQIFEVLFLIPLTLQQMIALDKTLTIITCTMLLAAMVVFWFSARMVTVLTRENLECLSRLSDHILDSYSSIPVIQGFNAQRPFLSKFSVLNEVYVINGLKVSALRSFVNPVVTLMGTATIGYLLWQGGNLVSQGSFTVGSLAAFSGYIGILVQKLFAFGWMINVIQRGMVSLTRVYELLDTPPALPVVKAALPAPESANDNREGYRFEIRNLSFTYPGSEDRGPSLSNLNLELPPGKTLGIFGHTGSGKSTLVHLMARVYTPPEGTIFLNGVDIRDIPVSALREIEALVPQDPFLFTSSIRENIIWGAGGGEEPNVDPARLARAVELSGLEPDIEMLSQGLDTVVGARGITLSGGQRQRVALARAFYRRFQILLLDDVLAAVDHKTEARLIENIYASQDVPSSGPIAEVADSESPKARAQSTVIVSHRVSALVHSDQIVVLEKGQMVDIGTHEELIARPGVYSETYRAQKEASSGQAERERFEPGSSCEVEFPDMVSPEVDGLVSALPELGRYVLESSTLESEPLLDAPKALGEEVDRG